MLAEVGREVQPWLSPWLAAEKPDLVLADPMALWGHREADRQGISVNGSYVSYMGTTLTSAVLASASAKQMMDAITASPGYADFTKVFGTQANYPFEAFEREDRTGISFMPREFHPQGANIGEEVAFTGPAIRPRAYTGDFPLEKVEAGNTLFISLGTVFNNQTEFFFSGPASKLSPICHGRSCCRTDSGLIRPSSDRRRRISCSRRRFRRSCRCWKGAGFSLPTAA